MHRAGALWKQFIKIPSLSLALIGIACAGGAQAQSSVSIYGVADGFAYSAKAGSVSKLALDDGGSAASRLGFRGEEDLGGDLKATFLLEMGVNLDNGSLVGNGGFGREARVGLSSRRWGTVDLGLQYSSLFWALFRSDPFNMHAVWGVTGNALNSADGLGAGHLTSTSGMRQANMVRYQTPGGNGWFGDASYTLGEAASDTRSGSSQSAAVGYVGSSFYLGYGMQRLYSGTAAAPVVAPARTTHQAITGYYDMGQLRLSGHYIVGNSDAADTNDVRHAAVGAIYTALPHKFSAQLLRRDVRNSPRDANYVDLGYDYFLSRRTALYTRILLVNNKDLASNGLARVAVTANSGDDVRVFGVGVRHTF
jgi:predicted porin